MATSRRARLSAADHEKRLEAERIHQPPKEITVCQLEVVVMPNGEVLCAGKSLGWVEGPNGLGKYITRPTKG